jgi:hypothetical protein
MEKIGIKKLLLKPLYQKYQKNSHALTKFLIALDIMEVSIKFILLHDIVLFYTIFRLLFSPKCLINHSFSRLKNVTFLIYRGVSSIPINYRKPSI